VAVRAHVLPGRGDLTWLNHANCRGRDTELFFTPGPASARVKAICQACPVAQPCLDLAMRSGALGVWAGTTHNERRNLRRRTRTKET
jgi:WhiB family redox-sensing transcriptional regulator